MNVMYIERDLKKKKKTWSETIDLSDEQPISGGDSKVFLTLPVLQGDLDALYQALQGLS